VNYTTAPHFIVTWPLTVSVWLAQFVEFHAGFHAFMLEPSAIYCAEEQPDTCDKTLNREGVCEILESSELPIVLNHAHSATPSTLLPGRTLCERFVRPIEAAMSVDRSEKVEMLIAKRMRVVSGRTPQRPALGLASPAVTTIAVRRHLSNIVQQIASDLARLPFPPVEYFPGCPGLQSMHIVMRRMSCMHAGTQGKLICVHTTSVYWDLASCS